MEVQSYNGEMERVILSAIIFNDAVLGAASSAYLQCDHLFRSDISNYILRFCVAYYLKHKTAPANAITTLPAEVQEKDEQLAKRITTLLETLEKPKTDNSERLIELAAKYYEKVQIERLSDTVQAKVSRDDTEGAIEAITGYKRISTGITTGVNPLVDEETIKAVYADDSWRSLLNFKQEDCKAFFGDTFCRSSFVVINASEKAGKSSMILELALMAAYQGRPVAYFEAGDMSQQQVFRRIYQRIAKHPRRAGIVRIPTSITVNDQDYGEDNPFTVTFDNVQYQEDMSAEIALNACRKWNMDLSGKSWNWKFSAHPQDLTVPKMEMILDEWERVDGFIPDFIFIDYADLLQSVGRNLEFRHLIFDTFNRLRGLSLARKCCLVTATQATADSYDASVQTRRYLSEDKRKASTPTAIIALSANQYERENQVSKLNFIIRRDDACNEYEQLYVAGCPAICSPMIKSCFPAYRRVVGQDVAPLAEFAQYGDTATQYTAPAQYSDTAVQNDDRRRR